MEQSSSIQAWLAWASQACLQGGSDTARLDAQLLLMHVLRCDRQWLFMHPDHQLSAEHLTAYQHLIAQRQQGTPVAHLLGYREFWTLSLAVNSHTLIPRPDTEVVVETILAMDLPAQAKVLELGTGTGAIALALASERPNWQILAVDKVAEAVSLAEQNRARYGFNKVTVAQSDWFSEVDGEFDLIVSNPPYLAADDEHLSLGDVRFEPRSALVADKQGLADIEHIVQAAPNYLAANGILVLEHGCEQGAQVRAILADKQLTKGYKKVKTVTDYANLDRVTYAQCNN